MALTKERKEQVVTLYQEWLDKSEGVFLAEYTGLSMPEMDELRAKVREAGGEFHVIKNSLGKLAFEASGLETPAEYFLGSSGI